MRTNRFRALALASALLTTALTGTLALHATRLVGGAFPGFVVVDPVDSSASAPSWLTVRAPGIAHRQVVGVVNLPFTSAAEIYEHVLAHPPEKAIRYRIRQPDGTTAEQTIRSRPFSEVDYAVLFGINLATGLTFLLVGIAALWRSPSAPTSLALYSLGLTAGAFSLTGYQVPVDLWIVRLHDLAGILVPASLLHLAVSLPSNRIIKRPTLAMTMVYAPWVLVALVDQLLLLGTPASSSLRDLTGLTHGIALAILLAVSTYDLCSSPSVIVRRRTAFTTIGVLAALGIPALIGSGRLPISLPFALDGLGSTVFLVPLVLGYAANVTEGFKIDNALRRIATFVAICATAVAGSAAANVAYQYAAPGDQALIPSPLVIASITAIALTLYSLTRSLFQSILNHWFDSSDYDRQEALTDLSDRLARAHGVASVIGEAEQLFAETFAPRATLMFLENKNGRMWRQSASLKERTELHLPNDMRERLERGEVLTRSGSPLDRGAALPDMWRELGIDLLVPLRGSPLFGVLALGPKRSGSIYTAKDVRFLKAACNQLALGMTKATLFDQMEEDAGISAVLIRAQNEIALSLNAPDILNRLCEITAAALEMECSHTLLWDPEQEAFVAVSSHGDTPEQAEELRIVRVPRHILGDLPNRLHSDDALLSPRDQARYHVLADMFRYRQSSVIIMPLRREGELIGLHLAGSRGDSPSLNSRHERIARGIGHASSMALANACLMEELASASRVKSDFVASMSHELRTPLNHIIGYNDLMIDGAFGDISEEQRDTLQRVRRSSHNLLDLIEATLNLSRLDANKIAVEEHDVTLQPLVADLADRLDHSCKKPGVEVEWKIRPGVSTLRTDPIKLQMVLKNLVENAVKFTEEGRVAIDIHLQGDGVEFEVSDTGAGIPKDKRAAIFEPFRRVHDPTAAPGVGLGLHIVRRLVDLMQGTITVESEVDLGSRFRIWLPFSPVLPDGMAHNPAQAREPAVPLSQTVH